MADTLIKVLIPTWFYGLDSTFDILASVIAFLVSYYSFKTYKMSGKKEHFYLYAAFTALSMGFLTLGMVTGYSYLAFSQCAPNCEPSIFNSTESVVSIGFLLHYIATIIAYLLLVKVYVPKGGKTFSPSIMYIFPLLKKAYQPFNLISFFILSYVVSRAFINYLSKRKKETFLSFFAFFGMAMYHLLLFFSSIHSYFYVGGHIFLILGCLSLLKILRGASK